MKPAGSFFAVLFFMLPAFLYSQNPASISFHGSVYDLADSTASLAPIVVNKSTGTGQTAGMGGSFSIQGNAADTFMVTAGGYEVVRICFRDSAKKDVYTLRIGLHMKETLMKPVAIYPIKDLETIKKEREVLGVAKTTSTQGFSDAVSSPVTYLYERFSKEGKSKAAVAAMENEDRTRDVLKDLFRTYVQAGVIDLKEEEFDNFILYLNIPEWYLKSAGEYELAVTIRQRYLQYRAAQRFHNNNQR